MIVGLLPLVHRIAREQKRIFLHVPIEDLYQAGCVGLVDAADRYVPCPGGFERFAWFKIMGAIVDSQKRRQFRDSMTPSFNEISDERDGWLPAELNTSTDPLQDEILELEQRRELLAKAWATLAPGDAELLTAWAEGQTNRQQCRISGLSENYTRLRVEQLIGRLRGMILQPQPDCRAA
jgi:RNA polymerase sigma factor (sigma-70 family)